MKYFSCVGKIFKYLFPHPQNNHLFRLFSSPNQAEEEKETHQVTRVLVLLLQ